MKRISLLLIVFSVLFEACSNNNSQKASVIVPEFLKSGDSIALIAPAYPVLDSMVKVCCGMLESFGLVPVIGPNAYRIHPADTMYHGARYAGTSAERAADFKWAFEDRSIKGIISLTGGYGSIHVLPYISNELISNNPKWFVGCSDITTLLLASVASGVMSVHGSMCLAIASKGLEDEGNLATIELLMGKVPSYTLPGDSLNIEGRAEGILVGGNMTNIVPVLGTEYDAFAGHDCILFIEEVGESMHCIDRQLSAILLHHKDRIKGVIVGEFVGCGDEFAYRSVESMIHDALKDLGIPVCFGFPAGHGKRNLPLVEGAMTRICVPASDSASVEQVVGL